MEPSSKNSQHSTISRLEKKCDEVPQPIAILDEIIKGTEYTPRVIIIMKSSEMDFVKGVRRYTEGMQTYMSKSRKNEKQV